MINATTCRNLIKKTSGLRVSTNAGKTLAEVLTEEATLITRTAKQLATHAGRKTIQRKDIQLAVELLREE